MDWIEDLLPEGYTRKKMFGGSAYYLNEKLILLIFESTGNTEHRGQTFDFEIWNGCMFPAEKEHHPSLLKEFSFLINHPVLPKWLYLPMDTEDFEENVTMMTKLLRRQDSRMGTVPKKKTSKKIKTTHKAKEEVIKDTRFPRMFSEEPADKVLKTARKISDLKNLGLQAEKDFIKAGIKDPQKLIKMGWQKAATKLFEAMPKKIHSIYTYAILGAVKNQHWHQISEADKKEAREFTKSFRGKKSKSGNKRKK